MNLGEYQKRNRRRIAFDRSESQQQGNFTLLSFLLLLILFEEIGKEMIDIKEIHGLATASIG